MLPGDTKFDTFLPFSSDQMIRNLSITIGDVGLGSIELCVTPIFMLRFLIIWSAAIRDYNFYVIRSMFNP